MPMSSPMMKRMLGFLSCACAGVAQRSAAEAVSSDNPLVIRFRFMTLVCLSAFWFFGFVFAAWSSHRGERFRSLVNRDFEQEDSEVTEIHFSVSVPSVCSC
jgi:hypothetical protein